VTTDLLHFSTRAFRIIIAAACFAGALAGAQAQGQSAEHRILRIVNDEPVSSYDVQSRMRLIMATARNPASEQALQRLRAQVIETLIDERLQLQEAESLGIEVTDQEIQDAIGRIEEQNGMPSGQLVQALTARSVDANTLVAQIRSTLAWRKAVGQRLRTNVSVSEADIDSYLNALQQKGGTEYLLGEIFIAASQPEDLPEAQQTAERLLQQLRRGTPFTELARQFSQSPTAGSGGDTGWIRPDQLERSLAEGVERLQPGQVTPPIKVSDGYYILALRDIRKYGAEGQQETLWDLRRLFLPYGSNANQRRQRAVLIRAAQARQTFNTCEAVEEYATAAGDPQNGTMGEVQLSELPSGLRPIVAQLEVGEASQVLRLQDGAMILMLCGKRTRSLDLPEREEIRQNLMLREADVVARRYLRELRQNAIIQSPEDRT